MNSTTAAVSVAVTASLTLAAGVTTAPAAVASPAHTPTVVYDCQGWRLGQVQPGAIQVSCFGTVVVKTAKWTQWTATSARAAKATLSVDNCQPTCQRGTFRSYPASVFLYQPGWHDGQRYFSRFRIRYQHNGQRHYLYRWGRYKGASIPVWMGGPTHA
jgi:hypothetical protein